ncbi:MAG: hypothetical protein K9L82_20110 [Chromatiaceae bacterium]|nr:hypothetical protein [Chromatiaceae bacterium]MCF7993403.1 hypothetical protein [Chromatiaceae bacterium]MCF8017312.1 hypothetical protein [Chromatiaceae bacterium]
MSKQKTLQHISYGLNTPQDLLDKLLHDAEKITDTPHRYDLFNFFVTAAVLYEWCHKYYKSHPISEELIAAAADQPNFEALPLESAGWITDNSCLPPTVILILVQPC